MFTTKGTMVNFKDTLSTCISVLTVFLNHRHQLVYVMLTIIYFKSHAVIKSIKNTYVPEIYSTTLMCIHGFDFTNLVPRPPAQTLSSRPDFVRDKVWAGGLGTRDYDFTSSISASAGVWPMMQMLYIWLEHYVFCSTLV